MPLSEKSQLQYDNIYSIIERKLGKPVNYEDTEAIMNVIRAKDNGQIVSDHTLKNRLSAVIHKSDNKFYKTEMENVKRRLNAKAEDPETNIAKEGEYTYKDFKDAFDKAEGKEKMVLGLYFLTPPRRIADYIHMVVRAKRPGRMFKKVNYLIMDEKKFVFNEYKTNDKYGRQEFDIPPDLWDLLKDFIGPDRALLINEGTGKVYTEPQFSDYMARINLRLVGKRGSATAFRHSFITHFLSGNPTTAERKRVSNLMAHDIRQQLEYDRRVAE